MPSLTLLLLSRWQFAFTVAFHMTFPAITVGLAVFLAFVYGMYLRTGERVYLQIFRFWKKIFAVGFALGVVAGTVITFEFGLNWGPYAAATGPILGPIIGMEVVTAFFLEAGFIGIMLYGDGRVSPRVMFTACCLVALGTVLSTTWILAANSWMQTPAGYRIVAGQFQPADWVAAIFNPSFAWRFPHMLLAVLISAAWLIGGICAYYLLVGRHLGFARRGFSLALGVLALLVPAQLYIGDNVAFLDLAYQPPKFEALEGNWTSDNTGYNLIVVPDLAHQRNLVQITIPKLDSVIAKDLSGHTAAPGLAQTPRSEQPNMWAVFYGFRVMFYAALVMFAAALTGVVLRLRRRLYVARWFHRWMVWLTPIGVAAVIGGWVTAETGRQPFVVYGLLRTDQAVSHLAPASLIGSMIAFVLVYLTLYATWIVYVIRAIRRGPDPADLTDPARLAEGAPGTGDTADKPGTAPAAEPPGV
ncbi:MAG: cytochrome ubiquinol oxidase subunit I [Pseudonocardiales bacterium]|nr:cytochrome ubiquinol oxidase subunit I [Pseudonocardiales bacterium]